MTNNCEIQVLGGGPAGLATAYFAVKHGFNCQLFEGASEVGGNFRTLRSGDFLFDTGAHRLHDKDLEVTHEIQELLGKHLLHVTAPSKIYSGGKFFEFPLRLADLFKHLDYETLLSIVVENIGLGRFRKPDNFAQFATGRFGRTLAHRFLLNYSAKLWGRKPEFLSIEIAGGRLQKMGLVSFVLDTCFGWYNHHRPKHLEGSFLYPKHGIGMISDAINESIGAENVKLNSRITEVIHDGKKIERVVINDDYTLPSSIVVNTLPITQLVKMFSPAPPPEIVSAAAAISFRHVVLCVLSLNQNSFSKNASIYFPENEYPFTRLYEPKNRSPAMAPEGKTAIVLEIPCHSEDKVWSLPDNELQPMVWDALQKVKRVADEDVVNFESFRLGFAYPVLEVGHLDVVKQLVSYFDRFDNLHMTGRNSLFRYLHFHDLFRAGKELIVEISKKN